jgi:molybdopterin-guanine dinucleotide biosynthesis protein A
MRPTGFVLVGGNSSRMGRDKALLPWNGATLAQHIARIVEDACGSVFLVGDSPRFESLGYRVYADRLPGHGPIGGILTALTIAPSEWSLVVGCDMPAITPGALRLLLDDASETTDQCIVPLGPDGPEPLCAVYHRTCLPVLEQAISDGRFKMRSVLKELSTRLLTGIDPGCFANLNTPEDFEAFSQR